MTDVILHHFALSPFAEKVRIGLGLKQAAWKSVDIPIIMPKPDLMPLTGGYPSIILFCCIGVYTLSSNIFDVRLIVLFGALGYLLAKIGCEPAPMLLGFILGPMMEEFFRRALLVSRGDFMVFVESPISAGLLATAMALLVSMSLPAIAQWRGKVTAEQNS